MHFLSHNKTLLLGALFSIVSFLPVNSMELIAASSVSSSEPVQLFSNHKDLFVQDENAAYRVEKYNMNSLLHEVMKCKAMGDFTEKGGYLRVKQLSDGKYLINASVRVDGGGAGGTAAGAWLGKIVTYTLCHGAIIAVSTGVNVVWPGSGVAVGIALEKTLAVPIEVASNTVAICGGIAGGILTGPV